MKHFKRSCIFFLSIWMITCLAGCSLPNIKQKSDSDNTYIDPYDAAEIVLQAVQDEDVESIHNIFCPYVQKNDHDLDSKIEGLFQFIDGNIISYDGPGRGPSGSEPDREGNRIISETSKVRTVRTDRNGNYEITVSLLKEYENKPDHIGVTGIMVFNKDKLIYDKTAGKYPDDAIYRVEYEGTFESF